jgi:hypothetical protein
MTDSRSWNSLSSDAFARPPRRALKDLQRLVLLYTGTPRSYAATEKLLWNVKKKLPLNMNKTNRGNAKRMPARDRITDDRVRDKVLNLRRRIPHALLAAHHVDSASLVGLQDADQCCDVSPVHSLQRKGAESVDRKKDLTRPRAITL